MTEKISAGAVKYCMLDPEMNKMKLRAVSLCQKLNSISILEGEAREAAVRELFGSAGARPRVMPVFHCDCGTNIHVGDNFLANYNVTILDRAPVRIGNDVMIGPGTLISTAGHPLSPKERRAQMAYMKPVTIGDDVWIGGNCTILPGVTIGSNVVVAAGAVVTKDVPGNTLAGGVPAHVIRALENDLDA